MANKKVVIYNLKQAAKFIKHGCIPVDWKYKMENDNVKIGLIFEVDELYKELKLVKKPRDLFKRDV